MGILLAFAPFIVFAVADRLIGATPGLAAAAAVSAVLLVRDRMMPGRSPKLLELGTFVLFAALALYSVLAAPTWSVFGVRLWVDAGLLLIVLFTIAIRRPFTLQYAREQVPREFWNTAQFRRTNDVITAVWALAFAVLVLADLSALYVPNLPPRVAIVATVLALVGAVKFTSWYPQRGRPPAGK